MAAVGARAAGVLRGTAINNPPRHNALYSNRRRNSNGEASRMARFNPGLALTFFFADLLRFLTCKSSTTTTAWLLLMRSVRGLMHEIFSHIGDVLVQFADFGFPFLPVDRELLLDRKSTRLNSSHSQ